MLTKAQISSQPQINKKLNVSISTVTHLTCLDLGNSHLAIPLYCFFNSPLITIFSHLVIVFLPSKNWIVFGVHFLASLHLYQLKLIPMLSRFIMQEFTSIFGISPLSLVNSGTAFVWLFSSSYNIKILTCTLRECITHDFRPPQANSCKIQTDILLPINQLVLNPEI